MPAIKRILPLLLWVLAVLVLAACRLPNQSGEASIRLLLSIPSQSRGAGSLPREWPAEQDAVYLQLLDGSVQIYGNLIPVTPGSTQEINETVPAGDFTVQVFACHQSQILGMAAAEGVSIIADQTTELSLTMQVLNIANGELRQDLGPGNPGAQNLYRAVLNIPLASQAWLESATVSLRCSVNSAPTGPQDATELFAGSIATDGTEAYLSGEVPAGTGVGNDTIYCWFTLEWPDTEVYFSDCYLSSPNRLVFDGGTVRGTVEGKNYNLSESSHFPESSVTAELKIGATNHYTTSTDSFGAYIFNDVAATTYDLFLTFNDTIRWTTYLFELQVNINNGGFNAIGSAPPELGSSYPSISYTSLNVTPGSITDMDFRFAGY